MPKRSRVHSYMPYGQHLLDVITICSIYDLLIEAYIHHFRLKYAWVHYISICRRIGPFDTKVQCASLSLILILIFRCNVRTSHSKGILIMPTVLQHLLRPKSTWRLFNLPWKCSICLVNTKQSNLAAWLFILSICCCFWKLCHVYKRDSNQC